MSLIQDISQSLQQPGISGSSYVESYHQPVVPQSGGYQPPQQKQQPAQFTPGPPAQMFVPSQSPVTHQVMVPCLSLHDEFVGSDFHFASSSSANYLWWLVFAFGIGAMIKRYRYSKRSVVSSLAACANDRDPREPQWLPQWNDGQLGWGFSLFLYITANVLFPTHHVIFFVVCWSCDTVLVAFKLITWRTE